MRYGSAWKNLKKKLKDQVDRHVPAACIFAIVLDKTFMEKQKRKIEVFSAGCFVCNPVVEMAKSLASGQCDVVVYNLSEPSEGESSQRKAEAYGIRSLPAIVLDGKLLPINTNAEIPIRDGVSAGVGSAVEAVGS